MNGYSKLSRIASAAVANALLLTACSSGSDNTAGEDVISFPTLAVRGLAEQDPTEVLRPWHVFIDAFRLDSRTPDTGNVQILTIQNDPSTTVQTYIDFYSTLIDLETCDINPPENLGGDDDGPLIVSGGENVVINAPNGTWLTLDEEEAGLYETANGLPGALPVGASVSIPGAVFPSVSAVPIAEPAVPERIAPLIGPVTTDSVYQWQAASGPGIHIQLDFLERDSNSGEFIDAPVVCYLEDDGEFELPANVLDFIANSNNPLEARYVRRVTTLELVEGVIAFSRISVTE